MVEIPELSISPETVRAIISMARRFDAKDAVTDPDPGSNGTDDGMLEVLEDHADDPVRAEITTFIHDLNVDEQVDLVALTWLGRGDGDLDNWDDLRAEASRAPTTIVRPPISSGRRCSPTIWRRRYRSLASPATIPTPRGSEASRVSGADLGRTTEVGLEV